MTKPHRPWEKLSDQGKVDFLYEWCSNLDVANHHLEIANQRLTLALNQLHSKILQAESKKEDSDSAQPEDSNEPKTR